MSAQPLDPTVDHSSRRDGLEAGLAAAFGPDSGPPLPAGGSVLKALRASLPSVPNVCLREPEAEALSPVLQPSSTELPSGMPERYQLHGELARGGMGCVLKGRDVDLCRDVAVKVLLETHAGRTELVQRFIEEAQIAGQLQHPGIVPVYDVGALSAKRPYFTMKLVKGRTLAAQLDDRNDSAEDRARLVGIFAQVCQTLAYAHARGVIHRDIKPANIMVGAFGEVQVMDWGLAKVLPSGGVADEQRPKRPAPEDASVIRTARSEGSDPPGSQTQVGSVMGTPAYMAPEQARGDIDLVDERADVFGLGAILCAILTGQPPFTGKPAEAQRKAQQADLADALARLVACGADAELVALAGRCLAAEPWHRPRHAGLVAQELTAYQHSVALRLQQAEMARVEATTRAREERKRRRLTVALALTLLLASLLGGGGWLWFVRERNAHQARLTQDVNDALQAATALREQARTPGATARLRAAEAREQAQRARALVESGTVDPALREKVRQLVAELNEEEQDHRLLLALDAARLAQAHTDARRGHFDTARAEPLFRQALRDFGVAPGEVSAKAAAARICQRPAAVQAALVGALDEWAGMLGGLPEREQEAEWASQVLAEVDSGPWRKKVRAALALPPSEKRDAALRQLAEQADVEREPASALAALASRVKGETAVRLLRRAQQRHPGDVWINHHLGLRLLEGPEPGEAVPYLTVAVALRPDSAGTHYNLASGLMKQRKWPEAEAAYRRALALEPDYAEARANLGLVLEEQGKTDAAIAAYRKALALRPDLVPPRYNLGGILTKQGKLEEAIVAYRKIIAQDPEHAQAYDGLAEALIRQGKMDDARAALRKAIALAPSSVNAHVRLGALLCDFDRDYDGAARMLRRAVALAPNNAQALHNLGVVLDAQGKRDEAIAAYRKALAVRPGMVWAQNNLGLALLRQGRLDEAIVALRKAIALKADHAHAYCNLGLALMKKGAFAESLRAFQRGHELGRREPRWRYPSAEWVAEAERLVQLQGRLPAVLAGKSSPTSAAEWLEYAYLCSLEQRHAASARFYGQAFAAEPKLADEQNAPHRYNAACAAALAGAGRGRDGASLGDVERARWRRQALTWLRADLRSWARRLDSGRPGERALVAQTLRSWQGRPHLAALREPAQQGQLPVEERAACRALWADVAALLARAERERP
jgi:serine/threonine-protein kinase